MAEQLLQGFPFDRLDTPAGEVIESGMPPAPSPATLPGDPVESLKAAHRKLGLRITARTPACNWDGEHMDLAMAVSGLKALEGGGLAAPS